MLNDLCWRLIIWSPLSSISGVLLKRKEILHACAQSWIDKYCSEYKVKSGPFVGMKYHSIPSSNSVLYPKLIGCYESELWTVVNHLIEIEPATIVNIGSAEGYYAVGFARSCPTSTVYAFDIDVAAQEACRSLALQNGVSRQIIVAGEMNPAALVELVRRVPAGVIISDCEGYERKMFNEEVVSHLVDWYLIIEAHDFLVPHTSENLKAIFLKTHSIVEIKAISDSDRMYNSSIKELQGLNAAIKKRLVTEDRPDGMLWLYLKPKTQN